MLTAVYNLKNEPVGEVDLPEDLFAVAWNPDLVHFAYEAQRANARLPWAHAKNRGEVAGGGKKPWRQKGTGRARHGSIRSPLWVGGGVSHGPSREKDFSKGINKKQRRIALLSLISKRLADQDLKIVDQLSLIDFPKTKTLAEAFSILIPARRRAVVVGSPENRALSLAARNLPRITPLAPESLNVVDILNHRYLIIEKNALAFISKHYRLQSK